MILKDLVLKSRNIENFDLTYYFKDNKRKMIHISCLIDMDLTDKVKTFEIVNKKTIKVVLE